MITTEIRAHLIIASIINAVVIGALIYVARVGDDKAILIFIFGYALLLFVNIMMWATAGKAGKAYMFITIALSILFLPLWFSASPN
jgi:hypothetical protein